MHEQLAAPDKFHYEKDLLVCLEHVLHTNQEWMVCLLEDFLFQQRGLNLIVIQYDILSEGFHGIDAARVHLLDQEHLSKTSLANHTLDNEIFQLSRLFLWLSLKEGIGPHLGYLGILRLHLIEATIAPLLRTAAYAQEVATSRCLTRGPS